MKQKNNWLPIDERLVPNIFSFTYPKSKWVRGLLFFEMILAVLAVIGTLVLVVLPKNITLPEEIKASTTTVKTPAK